MVLLYAVVAGDMQFVIDFFDNVAAENFVAFAVEIVVVEQMC